MEELVEGNENMPLKDFINGRLQGYGTLVRGVMWVPFLVERDYFSNFETGGVGGIGQNGVEEMSK